MLRLFSKITFTPAAVTDKGKVATDRETVVLDFVTNVTVDISHEELTSTAEIKIPRKLTFNGKDITTGIDAIFRRGDKVKIECGYYPELKTIFEGYIANVAIGAPLVIECEDEMFNLQKKHILYPTQHDLLYQKYGKKGKPLKKQRIIPKKMKLKKFITDVVLADTPYAKDLVCDIDMEIAIKRFDCSAREVLNKLKETFVGFYAYFQDGKLNVGFKNDANNTKTVEFQFNDNIIDDSRLQYRRQEDIQLICRATSYDVDTGETKSVTWPPDVGPETPSSHIDVFTTTRMTEEDLKKFAQKNCESRKYEGYRGSFLTFGENYVRPGDAAKLIDTKYPERNGTYIVRSVKRMFGTEGYRQLIELDVRVGFNTK